MVSPYGARRSAASGPAFAKDGPAVKDCILYVDNVLPI